MPPAISSGTNALATRIGPAALTAKQAASAAGVTRASAVSGMKASGEPLSGSAAVPWRMPEALIRRSSLPCELETASAAASMVEARVTSSGRIVRRGRGGEEEEEEEEELEALFASAASAARAVAEEGSLQVATTASNFPMPPPPRTSWRASSRPRPLSGPGARFVVEGRLEEGVREREVGKAKKSKKKVSLGGLERG